MKRRLIIGLLATLALVLSLLGAPLVTWAAPPAPTPAPGSHPEVAAPPLWGQPTTVRAREGLRLREGPSLVAGVILVLRDGETVTPGAGPVMAQGIAWSYVRVVRWGRTYEGFVAAAYLANYAGHQATGEHGLMVTAPAGLRLRQGPGADYAVSRTVPYGTIVQPTGVEQWGSGIRWAKVQIDGVSLWAAATYLSAV